jgi:hypothetical protein
MMVTFKKVIVAILRFILGPRLWPEAEPKKVIVTRTVESRTTIQNVSGIERALFEEFTRRVDALCDAFRNQFPEGNKSLSWHVSFTGPSGDVMGAGSVSCPWCGQRNRLAKGASKAICGSCKQPISLEPVQ